MDSIYGTTMIADKVGKDIEMLHHPNCYLTSPYICCHCCFSRVGDLPMQRVKFATKHEYEYLGNYKVLQTCFTNRKIDKVESPQQESRKN